MAEVVHVAYVRPRPRTVSLVTAGLHKGKGGRSLPIIETMAEDDETGAAAEAELKKGFETLEVVQPDPSVPVHYIYLNRPAQRNALTPAFFTDLPRALALLDRLPSARAIVLAARGPHFCAGIDLSTLAATSSPRSADRAVASELLRRRILALQATISAVERCRKPVVAAIHGACIGGGLDLVAACDIRCCDEGAFFAVKEVDLALAADLGSLQRLPSIVGYGNAADMALTGRGVPAAEAKAMGLVTRVFPSRAAMEEGVAALARGNLVILAPELHCSYPPRGTKGIGIDRIGGEIDGGDDGDEGGAAEEQGSDGGSGAGVRGDVELGHAHVT